MKKIKPIPSEIIIYQAEEGRFQIALSRDSDTIWLNLNQIADLYQTSVPNISMHIRNILKEEELSDISTVKNYLTVQTENERQVRRNIRYYSLEMILAIGYRVRSERGTQFRIWATQHLNEYLKKGFILDTKRLKGNDKLTDYFDDLLAQIRDIRASEQKAYQRVREIFALAADYNPSSQTAQLFFATMQNKMLYAATGKTAAEIILQRADSAQPNMGATSWKGSKVRKGDVTTAKNFLQVDEIDILNRIVNVFLEQAELKLIRRQELLTADWEKYLTKFLTENDLPILDNPGSVSQQQAIKHAEKQYLEFEIKRRELAEQEAEKRYLEDLQNGVKLV
ncbi:MAG TPA: virulence RhuM family protein, partial [Candidatus Cloacimonadota bacterium]|nr:virulence RhuM family protein [Candidatus Cloacimonadota bacterium]